MDEMNRLLVDASFLISPIRSCDSNHIACYSFFQNQDENTRWVVPTIAYFEYQAAQSRVRREGKKAYRDLYIPNVQVLEISTDLIRKTAELDLANVFDSLRGADLVYACMAKIEEIPLVTCDGHFEQYRNLITVINPVYDKKT